MARRTDQAVLLVGPSWGNIPLGPWHVHHVRFWALIVIALALLAAAHYLLFAADSDLINLPPDLLHSPDVVLFGATFAGLFLLALLLRSELASITRYRKNRTATRKGRIVPDIHFQR